MSGMYPNLNPEASAPMMDTTKFSVPPVNPNYPPPPAYHESYQDQAVTVQPVPATTTTIITRNMTFPPKSIKMKCFHCNEEIQTKVDSKATCLSYLFCTILCFLGCFCGCCLIPFCTKGTQDIIHTCPKCRRYLGIYERTRLRK